MQVLRLRANPQRLHGTKHLPSSDWTYGGTGFYSGQTTYHSMKIIVFNKIAKWKQLKTTAYLSDDKKIHCKNSLVVLTA